MTNIHVSYALRAYNQEKEIIRALDSVLAQQRPFPTQIVIGVDVSIDNTRQVVADYISTHANLPDVTFTPLYHSTPMGGAANLFAVLHACQGKYISWLDGDDYYHDPLKTIKQTQFLDENPDFGVCYSHFLLESPHLPEQQFCGRALPSPDLFSQLLQGNFITSPTALFRRDLLQYVDFEYFLQQHWTIDDYFIWLELCQHTKFQHFYDCFAVYTVTRPITDNTPLESHKYEREATDIRQYYLRKYPDNTTLTPQDLENQYHRVGFRSGIIMENRTLALDSLRHIQNKTTAQRVFQILFSLPFGWNTYLLYRRLRHKDRTSRAAIDKYFF